MLQQLLQSAERHSMFAPGCRLGVAVSGGADSIALVYALVELAPSWGLRLRVLHLNHLLRGAESQDDARFVADTARSLGLPVEITEVDVAREASGDNLEQAARGARQAFFTGFIRRGELDRVATGHTRSDQAETVLYRLLRGAGSTGLAGIRPVTAEGLVRPMLDVTRQEVREFLTRRSIVWREDSSNDDLRFDRNRIRHRLLPSLRDDWNPSIDNVLANLATLAGEDEQYWESQIQTLAADILRRGPDAVLVDLSRMAPLAPAVVRRLLRHAIAGAKGDLRGIEFGHVETLRELAASSEGDGAADLPGVHVTRSFDWLRLSPPGPNPAPAAYRIPISVPGVVEIPGSGVSLHCGPAAPEPAGDGYNTDSVSYLDGSRLPASLEVRNWAPGDRFHPADRQNARKMKEWFQRARVPLWERRGWPMLLSGNTVIWTRRFGAARGFAAPKGDSGALPVWESGKSPRE